MYDVLKENVGQTLEFLASEHERIVHNLRVMLANRDGLLAEVTAERDAALAERDAARAEIKAIPLEALQDVMGAAYYEGECTTIVMDWIGKLEAKGVQA